MFFLANLSVILSYYFATLLPCGTLHGCSRHLFFRILWVTPTLCQPIGCGIGHVNKPPYSTKPNSAQGAGVPIGHGVGFRPNPYISNAS